MRLSIILPAYNLDIVSSHYIKHDLRLISWINLNHSIKKLSHLSMV